MPFCVLLALGEVFIKEGDSIHTLIELLQAVALVWRVNSILSQAEAYEQGFNAQNTLKTADNRN